MLHLPRPPDPARRPFARTFMRIAELLKRRKPFVSLEFFPPRDRALWPAFFKTAEKLRALNPLFVSVTYGAMGGTRGNTMELVSRLKNECGLETMAHLTCVGASVDSVNAFLDALVESGVDNVLALRGDPPSDGAAPPPAAGGGLRCAADLVALIRARHRSLGIGVAAYPEGHPEAVSPEADLAYLKEKLDSGAEFAITQLFFDNALYFDFVRRARAAGITKPLIPGVLPVLSMGTIDRLVSKCGAHLPADYLARLQDADRRGGQAGVTRAGIAHAKGQALGLLAGGAPGVHLYTLNKAEACMEIAGGLGG